MPRSLWALLVLVITVVCARPALAQPAPPSNGFLPKVWDAVAKQDAAQAEKLIQAAEAQPAGERPSQLDLGHALLGLGELEVSLGDPTKGESHLRRALSVKLEASDDAKLLEASTRAALGVAYLELNRLEHAQVMLDHALLIFEKYALPPPLASRHGSALATYAELLRRQNRFTEAIAKLEQADPLFLASEGELGRFRLNARYGLAASVLEAGEVARGERLSRETFELAQRMQPQDDGMLVLLKGQLGLIASTKGDFPTADRLFKEAIALGEKKLDSNAPETIWCVGALAGARALAANRDEPIDRAETDRLFERALAHQEKRGRADQLLPVLEGYGLYLADSSRPAEAETVIRRAMAVAKASPGGQRVGLLSNLGIVLDDLGRLPEAVTVLREAIALAEKNGDSAFAPRQNLGTRLWRLGKTNETLPLFVRAQDEADEDLELAIKGGSDAQRRAIIARYGRMNRLPITFHLQALPKDPAAAKLALRTILRQKGRALDVGHSAVQQARRRAAASDVKLLDELAAARAELAQSLFAKAGDTTRRPLQAKVDRLEENLGRRFSEIAIESKSVEIDDVRAVLRPGQALVEIIGYRRYSTDTNRRVSWGEERYAAYILFPEGRIEARELGEASAIDPLARRVRAAIGSGGAFREDARALDELVFRPIRAMLGDTRDLWLSAEGALHLVPFGALIDETSRYALDRYRFTLVTSGRDLLRYKDKTKPTTSGASLIIAAPDFDTVLPAQPNGGPAEATNLRFPALPGTEAEAHRLAKLMPDARQVLAGAATKEALLAVRGPRLLHIASHGFFLSPTPTEQRAQKTDRGLELESKTQIVIPEDPLLRSGIALAGANRTPRQSLVTALEASSLDLWGTELVALSACETGLGEVERGEGVFGLRRALVLAGASTQLISLWKVDDDATAPLMASFYEHVLKGGGRSDALREAQLEMLANPKTSHPYYWAAFVVSGDDRTLDRQAPPLPREVKTAIAAKPVTPTRASAPPPAARPRGCACDTADASTSPPLAPMLGALLLATALRARRRAARVG